MTILLKIENNWQVCGGFFKKKKNTDSHLNDGVKFKASDAKVPQESFVKMWVKATMCGIWSK